MISVAESSAFSEKGHRHYQEDALFPVPHNAREQQSVWVVCDGVGGNPCGDKASQLVSREAADYLKGGLPPEMLQSYLSSKMKEHAAQHPACRQMSSTLTFLQIRDEDVLIGWCGDSRIYHFREEKILFRSRDHSLVQDLVEQGELTEEEARYDFRNNIITRAIGLQQDDIDFQSVEDVQTGDFFLLCTDGVTETFDDRQLSEIFSSQLNTEEIRETLLDACRSESSDNYTAYILQVG